MQTAFYLFPDLIDIRISDTADSFLMVLTLFLFSDCDAMLLGNVYHCVEGQVLQFRLAETGLEILDALLKKLILF